MPDESHQEYGAPRELSLQATFDRREPVVEFDLGWFSKSASRLPEAPWLSFVPTDRDRSQWRRQWRMEKLGQWISPYDVVRNGNRHLHAIGAGVRAVDATHAISIQTLDAPLVAPGRPSLLDFNNVPHRKVRAPHVVMQIEMETLTQVRLSIIERAEALPTDSKHEAETSVILRTGRGQSTDV